MCIVYKKFKFSQCLLEGYHAGTSGDSAPQLPPPPWTLPLDPTWGTIKQAFEYLAVKKNQNLMLLVASLFQSVKNFSYC